MIGDVNVRATHGKYVHRAWVYESFSYPIRLVCNTSPAWHFSRDQITDDPVDCPHCLNQIERRKLVASV